MIGQTFENNMISHSTFQPNDEIVLYSIATVFFINTDIKYRLGAVTVSVFASTA